jgi:hypothetical protein
MPEQLDPRRLAAERAWIAAYPALVTSGELVRALIALCSPLNVGPTGGLGLPLLAGALALLGSVGYALGRPAAGVVVLVWAAGSALLDLLVLREYAAGCVGVLIFVLLHRVRPRAGATASPRPLRWVLPAALVGVIDVVLPLSLGAVTPTRVEDVAPLASTTGADLDLARAWRAVGAADVRLVPRGELLVLEGVEVAHDQPVAIDPRRRALLVGDAVLRGEPLTGGSTGLVFVRRFGRVRGRVVLLRTSPDALQLSFEGLEVDCQRSRVALVLSAAPPERE